MSSLGRARRGYWRFLGGPSFSAALGGYILPALIANIIGRTGLFAVLAHGQVRPEIEQ
ncbi:hypothetical protein IAG41_16060 [Sphingomonas sp. JC676]|uniref:hypothetical protein n=1 Tax=Sphingomonas sp. JC676 TaxID=2768065 RepID=UPI001657F3D3|nr:hypothetical protein [Sphingomonas sp. JC676]MBC9033908.1 hypothetical protein [Sphingomonas sp. JC676]